MVIVVLPFFKLYLQKHLHAQLSRYPAYCAPLLPQISAQSLAREEYPACEHDPICVNLFSRLSIQIRQIGLRFLLFVHSTPIPPPEEITCGPDYRIQLNVSVVSNTICKISSVQELLQDQGLNEFCGLLVRCVGGLVENKRV